MARARLLKPDFFEDERLTAMPLGARLLFQGYWCQSDREGRLEDRPSRVAAFVFPAMGDEKLQAKCRREVITWRNLLVDAGCLRRYEVEGLPFLLVVNFLKHQKIHQNEPQSALPAPMVTNDHQWLPMVPRENASHASGDGSRSGSGSRNKAEAEAEAETARAPSETTVDFHPTTAPPWPDEEEVGFASQYVLAFRKRTGRDHPGASVVADCKQLERDFGIAACVQMATDLDWEKPPNYMRPKLSERRQMATASVGSSPPRKSDLYDE